MKFQALLLGLFMAIVTANASVVHNGVALSHRHVSLARRQTTTLEKKPRKRCLKRTSSSAAPSSTRSSTRASSTAARATTTKAPEPSQKSNSLTNNNSNNGNNNGNSNSNNSNNNNNNNNSGGSHGGIVNIQGPCGNSRATAQTNSESGPNGHIDWMNCGIHAGGWNPPNLNLGNVRYKSLGEALAMPNSPYQACREFIPLFEKYGAETGIPAIMIAAFALQESSCRPYITGGGGEQGLMQITRDKCGGAPGGDCKNPDFNIRTGARFFAGRVQANGGNLLISVGQYNGWHRGMTFDDATRARNSACCLCQNNLDYLHQYFNSWIMGINAYSNNFKKYNNLAVCGGH
ncbi:hypothetical protein MD484_g6025, partial [Candolleomyces efflorescens]